MTVHSAGILLFKFTKGAWRVMLVHPGGPFWTKKDLGAWSIPKGLFEKDENPLDAAKREFKEETGFDVDGHFIDLGEIRQPGNKIVHVWGLKQDLDVNKIESNTFTLEWPKGSGNVKEYPEIDKGEWFPLVQARGKILKAQAAFLDRLVKRIEGLPRQAGEPPTRLFELQ